MSDDQIGLRLAREAHRRKIQAAYTRQAIVIGTNIGYSLAVAAVLDVGLTQKPKVATDIYVACIAFTMLALTLIFAPQGEA